MSPSITLATLASVVNAEAELFLLSKIEGTAENAFPDRDVICSSVLFFDVLFFEDLPTKKPVKIIKIPTRKSRKTLLLPIHIILPLILYSVIEAAPRRYRAKR